MFLAVAASGTEHENGVNGWWRSTHSLIVSGEGMEVKTENMTMEWRREEAYSSVYRMQMAATLNTNANTEKDDVRWFLFKYWFGFSLFFFIFYQMHNTTNIMNVRCLRCESGV